MTGLYCIVLSSALKAFIMHTFLNATIVTGGLVMMTYILIQSGRRVFKNMYVDKNNAISGKIEKEQIVDPTNIKFN